MVGHSTAADLIGRIDTDERSVGTVFDLLANERRRHVLASLAASPESLALPDLAEDVGIRESDDTGDGLSETAVQDVALSLHHVHLPKLEADDVVEYDANRDLIKLSEPTGLIEDVAGE